MHVGLSVKIALVFASLFLLFGNGLVIYKNFDADWRLHQKEYLEMAVEKTTDPTTREMLMNRSPRIDQLIIKQFGDTRIDRCMTCHAAVDDERFKDAPQPYTTHPDIPGNHGFRIFGCTSCHSGNGRGLSTYDAHGEDPFWLEPLLTGPYVEEGCAKCHPAPFLEETPHLRRGAALFIEKACYGCHKVEGISTGKLGVELTTVGTKWHRDYLVESIELPRANNFESIMPKMDLTKDEIRDLTIFLECLTGENLVIGDVAHYNTLNEWKNQEPTEVPVTIGSGRQTFDRIHCAACHTIDGVGGKIGPDLSVVGLQRTREWHIQHLRDPRSLVSGSIMPDFRYSESELAALGLYLESLTGDEIREGELPIVPDEMTDTEETGA